MKCKNMEDIECNEMIISEKACMYCMIKQMFKMMRGKGNVDSATK